MAAVRTGGFIGRPGMLLGVELRFGCYEGM